jgi:hypothetical protein
MGQYEQAAAEAQVVYILLLDVCPLSKILGWWFLVQWQFWMSPPKLASGVINQWFTTSFNVCGH